VPWACFGHAGGASGSEKNEAPGSSWDVKVEETAISLRVDRRTAHNVGDKVGPACMYVGAILLRIHVSLNNPKSSRLLQ
jgi:hypothetical protein